MPSGKRLGAEFLPSDCCATSAQCRGFHALNDAAPWQVTPDQGAVAYQGSSEVAASIKLAALGTDLRSGLSAGMVLPDPADPSLGTIRVRASQS